jgi:hypothetical protein
MPASNELEIVFESLRRILTRYSTKLSVLTDGTSKYYLNTAALTKSKRPILFAGASIEKAYVSFHLMPVYASPKLLAKTSPELKKRMQGKACFNFKTVDEKLFKELETLTHAGFARFKEMGYI